MPIFVTQGRVSRGYIRGGMSKPEDRYAYVSRLCEQAGGRLLSLVATGGGGTEGVVTTQAFTTAEMKDLYGKAGKFDYKPMGGAA